MTIFINTNEWQKLNPDNTPDLRDFFLSDTTRDIPISRIFGERIHLTEFRHGLSIETTSFVGRIKIGQLHLTIQPKIKMHPLLNLLRYAYGLRDLMLHNTTQQSIADSTFQDILILQFIVEVRELWLRGLRKEYHQKSDSLSTLRGRVDLQQIVRKGGLHHATINCIHYPRTNDTVLNRVILAGLYFVARSTDDLLLRSESRRLAMQLDEGVTRQELNSDLLNAASLQMNRLSEAYRPALNILSLLLEGQGVTIQNELQVPLSGFLFDMNRFWEILLSRLIRENLPGYDVKDQHRLNNMMRYDPAHNLKRRRAPSPRPDYVILKDKEIVSIMDAKYRDIWEHGLPRDMLYQLAIYALSQGFQGKSTILYPVVDDLARRELIEIQDPVNNNSRAHVRLEPINLYELEQLIAETGSHGSRLRQQYVMDKVLS